MFLPHSVLDSVATVRLVGDLTPDLVRAFTSAISALATHEGIDTIRVEVDSLGGSFEACHNAAQAVLGVDQRKHVQFVVGAECKDQAYWLASQGDEIVVGPDSVVGFEFSSDTSADDRRNMLLDIGAARPGVEEGYWLGQDAVDAGLADKLA